MFRISQYMKELEQPLDNPVSRQPPGPVVIWNLVRRCNLTCKHCYSISADIDFPGELSTDEVFTTMDDLRNFGVPVLILSGGEPLLRPDIFDISRRAKEKGFYVGLSTNGTLINEGNIADIAAMNYDYVGISIDGIRETHDRFRQKEGAFEASMHAIRLCREAGIKVGMRFTPTQDNAHELPQMLDVMREEQVDKLYVSHLNYGGRGNRNRRSDVVHQATRRVMDLLFERCREDIQAGRSTEYVTGNNDADGVYLLQWVKRNLPERYDYLHQRLVQWGGNSSGVNIANIDNLGNVHPDTFWWNYNLGNVKERPFSEIWQDRNDPLMDGLKQSPRPLKGRCRVCHYQDVCGGNTRVRAFQLTGDPWWEDPACYLDDEELGISEADYSDDKPEPSELEIRTIRRAS
ncbi:heme d1 biosynthesis radical SAM protein NirJ [Thiogranum longum]|uniref:Pre-heme d1 synthase n=1 Tax=Thiogranum longum TaxID=1537524 RepID=A0A4R1H8M2_9GAMM|nr:heme d1 biosynthesis radical SAM protein NirJ [Thiogranum longum]TCK17598.1 heme d1 biosynthesis radical SAM protein NirJ [Thiogranum longum]